MADRKATKAVSNPDQLQAAQSPRAKRRKAARKPRGQGAERVPEILDAATEALAEGGFLNTSMDDIAARVGVTKPVIYRHFSSKDALLEALLERELTHDFAQTARLIADYAGPIRPLLKMIVARIDPTLPSRRNSYAVFRLILSDGYRAPDIAHKFFERSLLAINLALRTVFARAMAEGRMREADPGFAAREFGAPSMHTTLVMAIMGADYFEPWQARAYLDHALESFIRSYEIRD